MKSDYIIHLETLDNYRDTENFSRDREKRKKYIRTHEHKVSVF